MKATLESAPARFWKKVDRSGECWAWLGSRNSKGYGQFRPLGRGTESVMVHRYAYELLVGPIPDGLVIDHLCRNTRCVNPDHLEPVTHRVNLLRGVSPNVVAHITGICASGLHELTGYNVQKKASGGILCRECSNERHRRYLRRRRARQAAA